MALLGCGPKVMMELSSSLAENRCSVLMPVIAVVEVAAGLQNHDDLFERAVARRALRCR